MTGKISIIIPFMQSFFHNPVFLKEIRIGLRERKVFIIQIIYMLILGVVSFVFLAAVFGNSYRILQENGRDFFKALCITQFILLVLVSPSLTATAISSEREKKTFDLLRVSLLSSSEIIAGKLTYAASYIFLLLATSLPLVAIVFFVGGVSPADIIINYAILFLWGMLASVMALYFSSRENRSAVATNHTYGMLILLGFFILPFYIQFVIDPSSIRWLGSYTDISQALALIYLNLIMLFIFGFLKSANHLEPKSSIVVFMHRLFIFGFLLNLICFINFFTGFLTINFAKTSVDIDTMVIIWNWVLIGCLFLMGCFIEKQKFFSAKEEKKFNTHITSKPFFFPLFFTLAALITGVASLTIYPQEILKVFLSIFTFELFLWALIIYTHEIKKILPASRYRPVYIYFPILLIIIVFPLISWGLYDIANNSYSSARSPSVFSLTYVMPSFVLHSIWNPNNHLSYVSFMGGKFPTLFFTIAFYISGFFFLKLFSFYVVVRRKKAEEAS